MPDSRWVEGLCPRPALDTPSVRAWKVLFAATSVPARLSLRLLGGFSGSGSQSAFECGVAPACHQGSQMMPSTAGYFTAPPFSKNIFLRIYLESTVTTKHHIHREVKGILGTE